MFSADLNKKFDTLTLIEDEGYANAENEGRVGSSCRHSPNSKTPKKSLLSSSLAGERASAHNQISHRHQSPKQPYFTTEDTHVHEQPNQTVKDTEESGFKDDHPEPELLASSVGKEIGGRLVPSSLTISLLSLNDHQSDTDSNSTLKPFQVPSPKIGHHENSYSQQQTPQIFQQGHSGVAATLMDRKNSYGNVRLVASRSSITQQRMQPYHKFTSPPPTQMTNSALPLSPSLSQQDMYQAQARPISINRNVVPDSPSLGPTSLGGSPTKFWLSSQTPPRSVASSLSRNSRIYFQQQHQQTPPAILTNQDHLSQGQSNHGQSEPMHIPMNNYTLSASSQRGDTSPTLGPVQTPSEDLPMTPLFLGKHAGNFINDSYFGNVEARGIHSPDPPLAGTQINPQLEEILEMKANEEEDDANEQERNDQDMSMH